MNPHQCHIWLGLFGLEAPENYFVQEYSDEDIPQSQFGGEQEQNSFDYDITEISFPDQPMPVRDLVDGHSYSKSYLDLVANKASELGITEVNVFILADRDQFSRPRSVTGPHYKLWYLGRFECRDE